ncbi:MAG: hypothetical protein EOO99_01515 [Pedobacter sp.]|nr:MAG: hypothetical protein EOO99_01515 [Pedobacter sp.]
MSLLTLFIVYTISAFGQKLPEVQNKSVFLNHLVKIDGKDNEWNGTYEAENSHAVIQYKMAHDAKNLYIVIKSINKSNIQKIIRNGISISINKEGKRNLKDVYAISYPIPAVMNSGGSGSGGSFGGRVVGGSAGVTETRFEGRGTVITTTGSAMPAGNSNGNIRGSGSSGNNGRNLAENRARIDSLTRVSQLRSLAISKEIKVEGFPNIKDSTISIYNEYGLKVAASFNEVGHLIYEMAIPLNLIALTEMPKSELTYQIRVNGMPIGNNALQGRAMTSSGGTITMDRVVISGGGGGFSEVDLFNPAEIWGKYQIIKK